MSRNLKFLVTGLVAALAGLLSGAYLPGQFIALLSLVGIGTLMICYRVFDSEAPGRRGIGWVYGMIAAAAFLLPLWLAAAFL